MVDPLKAALITWWPRLNARAGEGPRAGKKGFLRDEEAMEAGIGGVAAWVETWPEWLVIRKLSFSHRRCLHEAVDGGGDGRKSFSAEPSYLKGYVL